jgi:hypothetical protein
MSLTTQRLTALVVKISHSGTTIYTALTEDNQA